ncbi:MAG: type II toxin-antitoxin system RelE/ParE family toxin [Pseudomonadota bacterium]
MTKRHNVLWANTAETDLAGIIEYIADDSPSNALEILNKIRDKASSFYHSPERGRIVPEFQEHGILQYRELVVAPWKIIYRITEDHVYVLSVLDSRQNIQDILFRRLISSRI